MGLRVDGVRKLVPGMVGSNDGDCLRGHECDGGV